MVFQRAVMYDKNQTANSNETNLYFYYLWYFSLLQSVFPNQKRKILLRMFEVLPDLCNAGIKNNETHFSMLYIDAYKTRYFSIAQCSQACIIAVSNKIYKNIRFFCSDVNILGSTKDKILIRSS